MEGIEIGASMFSIHVCCNGPCSCPTGGLFGSSTFSQPATSSTNAGFGFGGASGTSTSLFGSTGTGTTGGLFSQPSNAFGASKPTSFGSENPFYRRVLKKQLTCDKCVSWLICLLPKTVSRGVSSLCVLRLRNQHQQRRAVWVDQHYL